MSTLKDQLEKKGTQWTVKRDSPLQQFTLDTLRTAWGSGASEYFPGPQPVSIERKHFRHFKKQYVVCEKSDGVRHVLMAFMFQENKMCVMINRALDVTLVPLSLPRDAYKGTILDGELIDGKLFLVYDAVFVAGVSVGSKDLITRLVSAGPIVSGILKLVTNPVTVRMKTFFNMKDFEEFQTKYLPTLEYKTDGLIFTPVDEPVRTGTHETLFKWKPRYQNTIDFLVKKSGDKWSLYVQERGTMYFQGEIRGDVPDWITDGCIAECQFTSDETSKWWKPVGLRTDKVHPNNRRTFYSTLTNIKEDIKWEEFLKV
jgi:hypothetical protein